MTRLIIHLVSRFSFSHYFSFSICLYAPVQIYFFCPVSVCIFLCLCRSPSVITPLFVCLSLSFFLSVSFLVSVCLYDSLIPLCLRNWMSDCHNAFYPSIYTITTNNYIYIACSSKLFESKFIDIPQHHKKHCFDVEHAWKTVLRRKVRNRTVRTTS